VVKVVIFVVPIVVNFDVVVVVVVATVVDFDWLRIAGRVL